ncbi:hypothetical protein LJR225_002090 [Phenylobacterium sp. LjRoot225]|uniref:hypothetical protein n=1 Tax=Phenylobacterium sp. LjRoot225 TaxID=3342285 RepID=UPI003ED1103A
MSCRLPLLSAAALIALLTACGRGEPSGPVRTPMQASEIAQRTLRSAGVDEQIVAADRQGGAWIVTTRRRESSLAGHLVTVDAASGSVSVERYRSVQLGGPR